MNVVVTGKDSFKRRLVEAQVHWLIEDLQLGRSRLTLEIIPKPDLRLTHGANGLSGRHEDLIGFAIDTKLQVSQLISSVAHEMIHIKQMAQGRLRYEMKGNKEVVYWCGREMNNIPYYTRPWEIEAFGKQEILARRFNDVLSGTIHGRRKRKI